MISLIIETKNSDLTSKVEELEEKLKGMRLVNQQLLKEVDRLTVLNFCHWLIK